MGYAILRTQKLKSPVRARYGAENIFYAGIHRDEITPHLYAYVVPRDGERLNCRRWLGGSKALSQMQTEFAETIGRLHGLGRGIERSRARHVSICEFYSRINVPTPDISRAADLPQPRMLETKRRRSCGRWRQANRRNGILCRLLSG